MSATEILTALREVADQLTVILLLVLIVFVVIFGVQQPAERYDAEGHLLGDKWGRPWWVPGWVYRSCKSRERRLEKEVERYVSQTEERLAAFEAEQAKRPRSRRT